MPSVIKLIRSVTKEHGIFFIFFFGDNTNLQLHASLWLLKTEKQSKQFCPLISIRSLTRIMELDSQMWHLGSLTGS